MEITAQLVKELREMTGAGMMDSKKALMETKGDIEQAVEYLRKKGLAGAQKKAGRIAAEGIVMTKLSSDNKTGVVVEVNSETDFVAKNEKFRTYVSQVADQALKSNSKTIEEFLAEKWDLDNSKTVQDELSSQISIIGENMHIRRTEKLTVANGFVCDYIHAGGKIGVLLAVETDVVNDNIKSMAKSVCMQIAAMRPKFLDQSFITEDYKKHEMSILLEESKNDPKNAGKPDKIIEGMVNGKYNKLMKEVCLLDQDFVISNDNEKLTVLKYIEKFAKENNANVKIKNFVRFETGEGLEKKNEDFAAEVAKQMGK